MNKNIEEVIEIEKQAQAISQAAVRDAEKLPAQAQDEAQALLAEARQAAEREIKQTLGTDGAEQESARILSDAQQKADEDKALASQHMEQAVRFVIDRVMGKG
jgi:hypothetical protein